MLPSHPDAESHWIFSINVEGHISHHWRDESDRRLRSTKSHGPVRSCTLSYEAEQPSTISSLGTDGHDWNPKQIRSSSMWVPWIFSIFRKIFSMFVTYMETPPCDSHEGSGATGSPVSTKSIAFSAFFLSSIRCVSQMTKLIIVWLIFWDGWEPSLFGRLGSCGCITRFTATNLPRNFLYFWSNCVNYMM